MGAKLNSEKLGKFYKPGKRTATRREWRGFKDTMYDFGRWLKNLLVMGKFIMKPTTIKALIDGLATIWRLSTISTDTSKA